MFNESKMDLQKMLPGECRADDMLCSVSVSYSGKTPPGSGGQYGKVDYMFQHFLLHLFKILLIK